MVRSAGTLAGAAVSLAATFVAAAGPVHAQNLILNGSFETPSRGNAQFVTVAPPGDISAWTVSGAGLDHIGTLWEASDGAQSLDMSALAGGTISHTVTDHDRAIVHLLVRQERQLRRRQHCQTDGRAVRLSGPAHPVVRHER